MAAVSIPTGAFGLVARVVNLPRMLRVAACEPVRMLSAPNLTHVGADGRARMVDVSDKPQYAHPHPMLRTCIRGG